MTFTYLYTPCSLCGRVAVCRSTAGETLRRCLPCIQATCWYQAMTPDGRAIIVTAFGEAVMRLTREQDEEARLRRLLAPVEARVTW